MFIGLGQSSIGNALYYGPEYMSAGYFVIDEVIQFLCDHIIYGYKQYKLINTNN